MWFRLKALFNLSNPFFPPSEGIYCAAFYMFGKKPTLLRGSESTPREYDENILQLLFYYFIVLITFFNNFYVDFFPKTSYNILVVGFRKSGKTSTIRRFINNDFPRTEPTKSITVEKWVDLNFIEIPQQKLLSNNYDYNSYFDSLKSVFIVLDPLDTNRKHLYSSIIQNIYDKIAHNSEIQVYLIGTKHDRCSQRFISIPRHLKHAKTFYISNKTGDGFSELKEDLIKKMLYT